MDTDELPPLPEPLHPASAIGNGYTADQMREYAAAAVAREREECAALCDRFAERDMSPAECAAAIRKGGVM